MILRAQPAQFHFLPDGGIRNVDENNPKDWRWIVETTEHKTRIDVTAEELIALFAPYVDIGDIMSSQLSLTVTS